MPFSPEPPTSTNGPSISYRGQVEPDWIDANRHMNVSWYDRLFDKAEMTFFEEFNIDDAYINRSQLSFFRLEKLVKYERELILGDAVETRSRIIWTDFRRVHHFHELWNVNDNYRAAWVDAISIHVDLTQRKSTPIIDEKVRLPLERLTASHALLPRPDGVLPREAGRRTSS